MDQKKSYNIFQNILYLIKKSTEFDSKVMSLLVVYSFMIAAVPFFASFLSKYVIDGLVENKALFVISVILTFTITGIITQGLAPYVKSIYEPRIMGIREKFLNLLNKKVMEMDYEYTENPEIGKIIEMAMRAVSDNVSGIEGMLNSLFCMVGILISVIVYSIFIIVFKWWLFIVFALFLVIQIIMHIIQKNHELSKAEEIALCNRKKAYFYYVMGDFRNGKDIRLYNLRDYLGDKYLKACDEALGIQRRILNQRGISQTLENVFKAIKMIGIYLVLFISYREGEISIGQFSFYLSAMVSCDALALQFFKAFVEVISQSVFINDFRYFLELKDYASNENNKGFIIEEINKIEFENVYFSYPGSQDCVLKNVNLTIKKGERIALVGLNGAGKSTLIKLLCGFYRPTSGKIKVNGVDIVEINMESYTNCVSALFQDFQFFSFSIKENIQASVKEDAKKLQQIVDNLNLDSILCKLSKGIETTIYRVLDKDGVELSGGQSQRIAFARALYKNSSIVLLDEPTAALDVIAETKLYNDFNELTHDKTVIFISHRLASTKFCDRIVTLYGGKIDEIGSHDELMQKNGRYAELYKLQAGKYLIDE